MVESGSVVPADAICCTEPQPILTVLLNKINMVVHKTVLLRIISKLIAIEATNAVVPGGEPEIARAVFGDVFNALSRKAIVHGIGPPDAFAVKPFGHI